MADPTPTTTDDPEDICGLCGEPGADKMALYTGDGLPLEATEAPLCAECAAVHDAAPGEDRDAREEAAEIARQDRAVEEKAQIERFCFVDADGHAVDCDGVRRPE